MGMLAKPYSQRHIPHRISILTVKHTFILRTLLLEFGAFSAVATFEASITLSYFEFMGRLPCPALASLFSSANSSVSGVR